MEECAICKNVSEDVILEIWIDEKGEEVMVCGGWSCQDKAIAYGWTFFENGYLELP